MGGKAILLVVFGLSITLMTLNQNYGKLSNLSVQNAVDYQQRAEAHNAAVSGANIVCNKVFLNPMKDGPINLFSLLMNSA